MEWVGDTKTRIADSLEGWHDNLAAILAEPRPAGPRREQFKVAAALAYLLPRAEHVATAEWCEDAIEELGDLHNEVRRTLGLTAPKEWLDAAPC